MACHTQARSISSSPFSIYVIKTNRSFFKYSLDHLIFMCLALSGSLPVSTEGSTSFSFWVLVWPHPCRALIASLHRMQHWDLAFLGFHTWEVHEVLYFRWYLQIPHFWLSEFICQISGSCWRETCHIHLVTRSALLLHHFCGCLYTGVLFFLPPVSNTKDRSSPSYFFGKFSVDSSDTSLLLPCRELKGASLSSFATS